MKSEYKTYRAFNRDYKKHSNLQIFAYFENEYWLHESFFNVAEYFEPAPVRAGIRNGQILLISTKK
jgi:hypothetical protein